MVSDGGGGGAKPVLKIPVDTSEYDAFVERFMEYQDLLEKQEGAWANTNKGIRQQKTAFEDVDRAFSDLVDKAQKPKLTESFVKVTKNSKETEKSWRNISREIERAGKGMGGLARAGLGLGALGIFGGVGALAGGLFAGVRNADNSLADQNILNRKLGLKPGEEKAFSTVYEKAGGDTALLGKIATAQATPSQWRFLQAAGVSAKDIQSKDPEELSELFLKQVGAKVRELGPQQFGMWAQATGVTNFADVNSLRQAGSFSDADYDRMHGQYRQLQPQLAAQQKTLDEATAARQKIEAALAQDTLELDKAFIKLNPMILEITGKVTKWITAFAESGELERDIRATETAFKDVAKVFEEGRDTLNKLFGLSDTKDDGGTPLYQADAGSVGANIVQFGSNAWKFLHGEPLDNGPAPAVYWNPLGSGSANGTDTQSTDTSPDMDRLLDATKKVESSNGKNLVGPVTKEGWQALGAYQFSPADLKRYGVVDPMNEQQEREGARHKYADLVKKFGNNPHEVEAAYNWGEGKMESFLKSHKGQFVESDLPPEVREYLRKIDAAVSAGHTTPFDDPKAIKSVQAIDKLSVAQIVPFTADDTHAKATYDETDTQAAQESFAARMARAAQLFRDAVGNGGGAALRKPDQPARPAGNTQVAPYNINVTVTAPAGSNTAVTAGGLAQ
ncbi:lytic transglycosylase domain-containing protein [Paraburkholderia fungorum]|jgi:hypothetical protein|uniref:lytic transglycosylase domain-containing protein n=1 Tax=Paraburkholderia fungorum TaxID=134537 RepID=UPI00041A6383|nr:lytic transglycosylase domain-containing protein [Paraburkholderia fungorum]PZR49636.1 MAG: hypothetical protein DI523_06955 [Paraburkholderia fungorum]